MAFEWGDKLFDVIVAGVPGLALAIPDSTRKQLKAKFQDFNPFAGDISANEDLLRALRLAWIEAALEVDEAAIRAVNSPDWTVDKQAEAERFSKLVRTELRRVRAEAFDRDRHPGASPIDTHLHETLVEVPKYIRGWAGNSPGEVLTSSFVSTLAGVVGWPPQELPEIYGQLAISGLPQSGGGYRGFGELVFAAFSESIKSPDRYPEAKSAFHIAQADLAREIVLRTLRVAEGLDRRFDVLLRQLEQRPYVSFADFALLADASLRTEAKVEALGESLPAVVEQALRRVLAEQHSRSADGVPEATIVALARRLTPDSAPDLERALIELQYAVEIAAQVLKSGEHPAGHDKVVDAVLQRVAEATRAGRPEDGKESIDEALAEFERREEEQRLAMRVRREVLLKARLSQTLLTQDVSGATESVCWMGMLEEPERPHWTNAYSENMNRLLAIGEQSGINLALEVCIALARLRVSSARSWEERGNALQGLAGR